MATSATELLVVSSIDLAHSPGAEQRQNGIGTEAPAYERRLLTDVDGGKGWCLEKGVRRPLVCEQRLHLFLQRVVALAQLRQGLGPLALGTGDDGVIRMLDFTPSFARHLVRPFYE